LVAEGFTLSEFNAAIPALKSFCLNQMRGRCRPTIDDAEDIVQEALLRAWRNRDSFERKAKLSSWLCQILLNVLRDRDRYHKTRHSVTMPLFDEMPGSSCDYPDPAYEMSETQIAISIAVESLNDEPRDAFEVMVEMGTSPVRYCRDEGITISRARALADESRSLVRQRLEEDMEPAL
jgi:RNA polymerase sigma factor (sigma-70 family)